MPMHMQTSVDCLHNSKRRYDSIRGTCWEEASRRSQKRIKWGRRRWLWWNVLYIYETVRINKQLNDKWLKCFNEKSQLFFFEKSNHNYKHEEDREGLEMAEQLRVLPLRAQVWFPASTLGGSQLSVAPISGNALSSLQGTRHANGA